MGGEPFPRHLQKIAVAPLRTSPGSRPCNAGRPAVDRMRGERKRGLLGIAPGGASRHDADRACAKPPHFRSRCRRVSGGSRPGATRPDRGEGGRPGINCRPPRPPDADYRPRRRPFPLRPGPARRRARRGRPVHGGLRAEGHPATRRRAQAPGQRAGGGGPGLSRPPTSRTPTARRSARRRPHAALRRPQEDAGAHRPRLGRHKSVLDAVTGGRAHIGVGGLFRPVAPAPEARPEACRKLLPGHTAPPPEPSAPVLWSAGYFTIEPLLRLRRGRLSAGRLARPRGRGRGLRTGSGLEDQLTAIRAAHPDVEWTAVDAPSGYALDRAGERRPQRLRRRRLATPRSRATSISISTSPFRSTAAGDRVGGWCWNNT